MLIHCMDDGRISTNDVLYGQLRTGVRIVGVPHSAVQGSKQTWPQSIRNLSKQLERCCVWSCLLEMESERSNRKNRRERSPVSWGERLPQKQLHHVFLRDRDSRNGIKSHTRRCSTTRDWQGRISYVSRDFACQWWWWSWWCHLANQMLSNFKNQFIFKNNCLTSEIHYMTWCAKNLTEIRERVYFFLIPYSFVLFCIQISWGIY